MRVKKKHTGSNFPIQQLTAQNREEESQRDHPTYMPQSSYNLISEMTTHHFYCILLDRSKSLSLAFKGIHTYINTRLQESLGTMRGPTQMLKY